MIPSQWTMWMEKGLLAARHCGKGSCRELTGGNFRTPENWKIPV
jgi:hypothetical protein